MTTPTSQSRVLALISATQELALVKHDGQTFSLSREGVLTSAHKTRGLNAERVRAMVATGFEMEGTLADVQRTFSEALTTHGGVMLLLHMLNRELSVRVRGECAVELETRLSDPAHVALVRACLAKLPRVPSHDVAGARMLALGPQVRALLDGWAAP